MKVALVRQPRRLLIVTSTFFPHPVVAATRMTQWCRFLPQHGWEPVVVTRHYGFTATGESLAERVHPSVIVRYVGPMRNKLAHSNTVKASRLVAAAALGKFAVPDVSLSFWRKARTRISEIVDEFRPDALLTTSPSHSVHAVGLWFCDRVPIPWIADFRDPYLIDRRYAPRGFGRIFCPLHRHYERTIYERASLVTHAIPLHARWARRRYMFARSKISLLLNGAPPELRDPHFPAIISETGRRSVRLIGATGPSEMLLLAKAMRVLVERGHNLELRVVGSEPHNTLALRGQLGDRLVLTGTVSHHDALRNIVGADVLVSALSRERAQCMGLSSKLFEYLSVGKPVLLINPTLPDRQFVQQFDGVEWLESPTQAAVEEHLTRALGTHSHTLRAQGIRLATEYGRESQTARLASMLDEIRHQT